MIYCDSTETGRVPCPRHRHHLPLHHIVLHCTDARFKLDHAERPISGYVRRLLTAALMRTHRRSGRKVLSLQRTRFRLLRTVRKIDSEYATVTVFEEAAKCLSFDVFSHNSKTRHSLQVA